MDRVHNKCTVLTFENHLDASISKPYIISK